ncbi:type IV secretory system conjugative DNA transfer family protein [Nocardia bovistercoris]|uniref:Type IV secretory system conjugative DNA transfer family protein n=1 Tax=Nocardia bovistercoris TaxID=2785916 RepID=A0A931IF98_9NOCA|nr:type IV secretory system conjugative DNA transfer family protein [Nocardia bovistercoris]MBH0779386.1 type IV secretory system conjugative DNA transfer family protein [Nocardia bovistercoris]
MTTDQLPLPLTPTAMVWQSVFWPSPFDETSALGLLRHWAAQDHRPKIILEARADSHGIRYLIGTQRRYAETIRRSVEQLVPGSMVTGSPEDSRPPVGASRRLGLSASDWPLEAVDRLTAGRSILSALTAATDNETLVIQIVLGHGHQPSLPPAERHDSHQSVLSKALIGLQSDDRPGATQAISRKMGQHAFSATVRIGVSALAAGRRKSLLLNLASALGTVNAAGVHLRLKSDAPERLNSPRTSFWSLFTPPSRLSVPEITLLVAWPIRDKDDIPLPGVPSSHPRLVRPTPSVQSGERIIALANAPGSSGTVGYNVVDSLRHTWLVGPTGTGKSTLLLNLIVQDLEANRPVVVIEPKDLINDVLERIPASRRDDVVIIDPLSDAPVGLNPLDRSPGSGRENISPDVIADSMFGTFRSLYGESLGPRSGDILRNCLKALVHREDASLIMLPLILTNPAFRRPLMQAAVRDDPFTSGPFWQWYEGMTPEAAANVVAPLSNKIRPLLDRHLRAVLAQQRPRFNVRQVLNDRKILLVPLQKGIIGPEASRLLAAVVLYDLWQAILERVSLPEGLRIPVMVYIDEVQEFLNLPTDLDEALALSRSLRAGFHLAHQYERQLPAAMLNAFRNNARNRVTFALNADDAKTAATGQSVLTAEDFTALPAHHIYARLVRSNSMQPWVSGVTQAPPPKTSDPAKIRRLSRERYGRPVREIEAGFSQLLDGLGSDGPGNRTNQRRRRS